MEITQYKPYENHAEQFLKNYLPFVLVGLIFVYYGIKEARE